MTVIGKRVVVPGQPAPGVQNVLRGDNRVVRDILLEDQNDYFDAPDRPRGIEKSRYLSSEFYQREVEEVWGRTWQMACRAEQIPNVGDYLLYEVADKSIIVMRSAPDRIQAFFNACPHRDRSFRDEPSGRLTRLRCAFHGMTWNLDGTLHEIPARWDFPEIDDEEFCLPEAKVALWGGFVFLNMDPECVAFADYIGDFGAHLDGAEYENRSIAAHVGLVIRANWKVVTEAFIENYHSLATHPQGLPYVQSSATQFTARKDRPHYSRLLFTMGVPNAVVRGATSEEETFARMREHMCRPGEEAQWIFQPGRTARAQVADIYRARLTQLTNGRDFSETPESELLDAWVYHVFPSVFIYGGHTNLFWRIRPWADTPEQSLMEVMFLVPVPKDTPRPAPAKMTFLEAGRKFSDASELGYIGRFMDQDLGNLAAVQKGLHSMPQKRSTLARYQESLILHFHRTVDLYLQGERPTCASRPGA